jgi:hypothetical protein
MAGQIIFFEKSKCDISNPNVVTTASQGDDYADYILNRNNDIKWVTTGSVDADNTTIEVDMVDENPISDILLVNHNFKSFKVEYWNGSAWTTFSTPIDQTTNTASTNRFSFTEVSTTKLKLTVRGTQTANEDKYLGQFIATRLIGQLSTWPTIKKPVHSRNKQSSPMLSGKEFIAENVGGFSVDLAIKILSDATDLAVIEELFDSNEGFLVWLCGGDESQFTTARKGYRLQDVYLMKCKNDYTPELYKGLYKSGYKIDLNLEEVVS